MIKIENTEVVGWEHAIRGMRNPMNSWDKSDSFLGCRIDKNDNVIGEHPVGEPQKCDTCSWCEPLCYGNPDRQEYIVGNKDLELMKSLSLAGTDHSKFLRMIVIYTDITAPMYWWKEFDTYKVGTVRNSCSTMHKIHSKEFTMDDFSTDHLDVTSKEVLGITIAHMNIERTMFINHNDKHHWWNMIQLLPSSYNQKATVMMNYQVLKNIYHSRKNHKLDEWRQFCDWIRSLPYSELITGEDS